MAYLLGTHYWRRELESLGVAVHDLGLKFYGQPAPLWKLRRIVREFRPALLHAHMPPAELYARFALLGTPARQLPMLITKHNEERFYDGPCRKALARWVARRAEKVIAISHSVRRYMIETDPGLPAAQLVTIHYALEAAPYLAVPPERAAAVRAEWGVPPEALLIGTIARLVPQKSLETLLEAFARFTKRPGAPPARLAIVGHGPLEGELRELARSKGLEGQVVWAGFREDIPAVAAAFDLFALTSIYEGFGLVLLEAMAAARPVVATRVSSIPEIVEDGVTGILIPPREPARLDEAFTALVAEERRRALGAAGRQRVLAHFVPARMFAETDSVYAECLR